VQQVQQKKKKNSHKNSSPKNNDNLTSMPCSIDKINRTKS